MRTAFIETLMEQAEQDERIWLMTGDLGFSVLEPFAERFPERYVNAGVAEQNMTGLAAGAALSGKVALTYSIANFPIMRCLEQIRNDVCYHHLDVKIVAVGGGLAYGTAGYTHHALEDLAVMRAMPDMTVIAPGDPVETRLATKAMLRAPGPCYLRLGKAQKPAVHEGEPEFEIGKAIVVRDGTDVTLISTGSMLEAAVQAAEELAEAGIDARVVSMHTVRPLDNDAVLRAARETHAVVTLEEHRRSGGLGGAVAEILAESDCGATPFRRLAVSDEALHEIGSQKYLRRLSGLSVEQIAASVTETISGGSGQPQNEGT